MKHILTRKQFLTSVAAGLAGAALPSPLLKAATTPRAAINTVTASKTILDMFSGSVGTTFLAHPAGREAVALTLLDVEKVKSSDGTTQFSLRFMASGGSTLPEGILDVEHSALGSFQIFLVPAGSDGKGQPIFRADFNLLDAQPQKRR
jgi:hypothetical protein